ncbi:hypothetical protein ASC64_19115 [Nocardioides sp. Root122]|uniref:hypothetical protein n=1 Tax=Nocardioides TaxID=1839 RepID=UPI0007031693|nr:MULTISPECIES: hypothetical protein [Nocardioides]KQV72761.1 hypothetical protein ASC64_19115 [Nocardioides sp. Root122]MCK9825312.1 hypothetical protein [Nocardioides cavernae]
MALLLLLRDPRHDADPGAVDVRRASPAAATTALTDFVAAVDAGDSRSLAALAPDGDEDAADLLAGIGDNVAALDLRGVTARYVDQTGTVAADGSWSGVVELTWRLGAYDAGRSRADLRVDFAPSGDGFGIAGFGGGAGGGPGRVPLWLQGELSVSRSPDVLVLADGARPDAEAVAARVERGIRVVRRVLPDWSAPVVVEVPASAAALDETLGVDPGTYAGIAAVTTTAGTAADDAPVHVFVNPEVIAGLRPTGAQVVMSHELVHVATGAASAPGEPWLVEGFADYVALRDVDLPETTTLGRAIDLARRDGVPQALPSAADFDTRAVDLQARYEQAWLACRVVAERLGEQGLVDVYGATADGAPVGRVLARAGLPLRQLTRTWRTRLQDLAG